jgi:tripartite-type tricarboxylate transporter receptor subunit TctC
MMSFGLAGPLGQQLIVDNRGSGVIPGSIVAKAVPDGYTLLVYGGTFLLSPLMLDQPPYHPLRDFAPITLISDSPVILVVHPSVPANTVKELIALAKAKPGSLNYASASSGSASHLAGELFKAMTATDIMRINYKGNGPAVLDLLGGRVQVMFVNAATVTPSIKSGKLKALAVASNAPSALAPNVPTVSAAGVPGYEASSKIGMFAPARTPDAIIKRLNQDAVRYIRTPEAKELIFNQGADAVGSSPEQFIASIKSDLARMGKVIKDLGIKEE